jgi:hypothetical protein
MFVRLVKTWVFGMYSKAVSGSQEAAFVSPAS